MVDPRRRSWLAVLALCSLTELSAAVSSGTSGGARLGIEELKEPLPTAPSSSASRRRRRAAPSSAQTLAQIAAVLEDRERPVSHIDGPAFVARGVFEHSQQAESVLNTSRRQLPEMDWPTVPEELWQSLGNRSVLLMELHIPQMNLQELRSRSRLQLGDLLLGLRDLLSEAAGVPRERLIINSIHGRFQRVEAAPPPQAAAAAWIPQTWRGTPSPGSIPAEYAKMSEEVVVRVGLAEKALPHEPDEQAIIHALQEALGRPGPSEGAEKQGAGLWSLLENATLAPADKVVIMEPAPSPQTGSETIATLALPMGIAAALTGLLVCLGGW